MDLDSIIYNDSDDTRLLSFENSINEKNSRIHFLNDSDFETNISKKNKDIKDSELIKIYNYFNYQGIYNIITIQISNLFSTFFLISIIFFLIKCLDLEAISNIKNEEVDFSDYIKTKNLYNNGFINILCIILFIFYIILRIFTIIDDTSKYYKIKRFYKEKLNINTKKLISYNWDNIIDSIKIRYGEKYNIYNINSRILKRENLMISIFETNIKKFCFSKLMEWNLSFCIFDTILDHCDNKDNINILNDSILDINKKNKNRIEIIDKTELINKCRNKLLTWALITYLFMPLLSLYIFFFSILKYGEKYYNNPSKIIYRQWTLSAKWNLRYYNELRHNFDERMGISSKYIKNYIDLFKSKVFETIIKLIIFICSSFFIVLLLLSLYNEHILLNLNISNDKPVLWYMGILGSIIAVCKTVIKNNNKLEKYEAEELYQKIIRNNKFIDVNYFDSNDEKNNNYKKMNNIKKFISYQIVILLKECFSVFLVPFMLVYLCNYLKNIVNSVENLLIYDDTIGLIDKKSHFRIINNESDKKSIISFEIFRKKYPLWGSNIELYQLSRMEGDNETINNQNTSEQKRKNKNYSIFDYTFDSEISII